MTTPIGGGLALALDGIPTVGTTAERNARFPTPPDGFKVYNQETKQFELYAAGWTGTVSVVDVSRYVDTTGATDSASALAAAITAAGAGGELYFPPNAVVRLDSAVTVSLRQRWRFAPGAKLRKYHTGNGLVVTGAQFEAEYLTLEAATEVSATYAQGRGVYYSASGTDDSTLLRPVISNIDVCLEWAADAGKRCNLIVPHFEPYTTTAGSEGTILKTNADTGAMQREVISLNGSGVVDVSGAQDMSFAGGSIRRQVDSAATFAVRWEGMLFGSLGTAMTFNGTTMAVIGCRIAGDVTLSSSFTGSFLGNQQTAGTFTDNTVANNARVLHHPLGGNYDLLDRHKLMTGSTTGSLIKTCRRLSIGDADSTFDPLGGVSHIRYGTALTAPRTVTLTTTGAQGNVGCRISRPAAGASGLDVGGLVTLAAGEWCDVEFNGSAYEVTAKGTGV